jgi:hypothetical protein
MRILLLTLAIVGCQAQDQKMGRYCSIWATGVCAETEFEEYAMRELDAKLFLDPVARAQVCETPWPGSMCSKP